MGEKIKKIAEIQLGGNRFDIELNHSTSTVGEREIHLQNDCFRVAFSEHEFLQLASGILLARRQLQQIKGEQLQRLGAAEGKPI